jgi:L-rhamnose isomerase/sugar isomerase
MPYDMKAAYALLCDLLADRGVDAEAVKAKLKAQRIETPSWAYADGGTRFKVFKQPGAAVTIQEKLADAAQVHKLTGICPKVAVHVLWDFVGVEVAEVMECAASVGVQIGAINPTLFEQDEYLFGSIAHPDPKVRRKTVSHILDSIEIGRQTGSDFLSLWFGDGTNYPGMDDIVARKHRVEECLKTAYDAMPEGMVMGIEYKMFEPGFYHTDIGDWGMARAFAEKCGERAKVLVDLGHHARATNIEHIVAFLIDEGRLGGFHFNNARYADDDLTFGSVNPYEGFLIYNELVKAEAADPGLKLAYMIDQCHGEKPKIEGMIQTVEHIQYTYAKALCLDRGRLAQAQAELDIVGAENVMQQAFFTDVRPLLHVVREEMGLPPEPLKAYRESGYQAKIAAERGIRSGGGGLG